MDAAKLDNVSLHIGTNDIAFNTVNPAHKLSVLIDKICTKSSEYLDIPVNINLIPSPQTITPKKQETNKFLTVHPVNSNCHLLSYRLQYECF